MTEEIEKVQVDQPEISVDHDQLIDATSKWAQEDADRASSAGETRQRIGEFIEETGVNSKALSHIRAGLKLKKESARLDWLRSMELMLPMVAAHIRGQSSGELPIDKDAA